MDGAFYFFSHFLLFIFIQILFFVNEEGLDYQSIHSDGLNIKISNIYAKRATESLWSL